jgi:tetratricopeptide (TPR) repeat protein
MRPLHFYLLFLILLYGPVLFSQTGNNLTPEEHNRLGNDMLQSFRFQEALNHFFECQRTEPGNTDYLSKTAYCYYQLGNLTEARIYYQQTLKTDSANVPALNYLANIEEQLLNYPASMKALKTLISIDSTNSYYYRQSGAVAEKIGDYELAVNNYLEALRFNPNDNGALISLCNLYAGSERLLLADSLLNTALFKQPGNLRLLYTSSEVNYRLRQFDRAVQAIQKAHVLGDTNLQYLPILPFSLAQLERCEEAVPWFDYLMKRRNPNEHTHYFLGFCYQKLNEFAKSEEQYGRAIELGISQNIAVYYQRSGDVLAMQKSHKAALDAYSKALDFGATDPVILFHMGISYDILNKSDKRKSLEMYRKYLRSNDPNNPDFRKYAAQRIGEIDYYNKNIWKGD